MKAAQILREITIRSEPRDAFSQPNQIVGRFADVRGWATVHAQKFGQTFNPREKC